MISSNQIWHFSSCDLYVTTRWVDFDKNWHCFRIYFDKFCNSWIRDDPQTISEQFIVNNATLIKGPFV